MNVGFSVERCRKFKRVKRSSKEQNHVVIGPRVLYKFKGNITGVQAFKNFLVLRNCKEVSVISLVCLFVLLFFLSRKDSREDIKKLQNSRSCGYTGQTGRRFNENNPEKIDIMNLSQPGFCQEESCHKKSLELSERLKDHENKGNLTSHCISKRLLQLLPGKLSTNENRKKTFF